MRSKEYENWQVFKIHLSLGHTHCGSINHGNVIFKQYLRAPT